MNKEQFDRERLYRATLAIARVMHRKGLISKDEYAVIDTKMREKYRPLLGTLCPAESPNGLDIYGFLSDI